MTPTVSSAGLLVLGMHRSGTSALAHVLQICGADLGSRVVGESAGNEAGHWEDAFAVEVHERLLAALGTRWDEALGLGADWKAGEAAREARQEIGAYVDSDRSRHPLWVVKDPRLSLFVDLWIEAAAAAGQPIGAVLMLRHPLEVAKSLAARDGIAPARGLLLWLEYTLAAAAAMEQVPGTVITYARLLDDWRGCVEQVRQLPGGGRLRVDARHAKAVEAFLDGKLRHHEEDDSAQLPQIVREVWKELSDFAADGRIPDGAVKRLLRRIGPVRQLVHPLLAEMRVTQRKLWERIARAEAPLADVAATSLPSGFATLQEAISRQHADLAQIEPRLLAIETGLAPLSAGIPAELKSMAEQVELNRSALVDAISTDLRRMQAMTAQAMQDAAVREREAALAHQIEPRLQAMEAELLPLAQRMPAELGALSATVELNRTALVEAISGDLRRMQSVTANAQQTAAVHEREAELAREIAPRLQAMEAGLLPLAQRVPDELGALSATVELSRVALMEAISGDLKRMQVVTAEAMQSAASSEREAQLARDIAPRLQAMEAALLPLAQRIPGELGALSAALDTHRVALVQAISDDLRRMQGVAADALQAAAAREQEAALARQVGPRLQQVESVLGELVAGKPLQEQLEAWIARATRAATQCERLEAELASARTEADEARSLTRERASRIAELEAQLESQSLQSARLEAQLDEGRSQLLLLEHEARLLRADSDMLAMVKHSSSWRLTRPLRVARRVLTGKARNEASMLRQWIRKGIARTPLLSRRAKTDLIGRTLLSAPGEAPAHLPDAELASLVSLQPARQGFADVFVWSVIDWHFRIQRPQHLARALADRGHRVFYISNNFVDAPGPGFRVEPLDRSGRLFQVNLHLAGSPPIYFGLPSEAQVQALQASLGTLLGWSTTQASLSLVQHPYWSRLTRAVPNARVVYDCMDHHAGFENNAPAILEAERRLLADADMVTVTSSWLECELAPLAGATAMIRNAGEYAFFSKVPDKVFADPDGRRVIGYFGAIAEWFDLDLMRKVALAHPDKLVLLVGNDTIDARGSLADLDNVQLVGEVPYADLPYWLHGFDVALLPFRIIELTMATNPVKVYEYLAAGKPVVAVDLPEMAQFDGLVRVAADAGDFVAAVGEVVEALATGDDGSDARAARQAFAAGQTWDHRASALDHAIALIDEPLVSVIVLTYNNLAFTQNCLFSIEAYSDYRNVEVIVVDNASTDGSPEWLQAWADEPSAAGHRRRLILNDSNLGFSAGNNVGLRVANGEVLIVLNNDTYVTFGWVRTLCAHLRRNPKLGLVGPVTNNIGNEAKLDIQYEDIVDMHRVAGAYTRSHPGQSLPLKTAAFFCAAMPRRVHEKVGGLDEAFGLGFFEDDDYCRRVAEAGWEVACAEDVFVHHHLSASFDALKAEAKQKLFETNKAIYEAKWGPWEPHVYRSASPDR